MTFCCDALKQMAEEYDFPFYQPMMFNRESFEMYTGPWSIKLLKKTKAGNISKKGGATFLMSYCPACGTNLEKQE